ncbi:protein of unknown function (plasmid) [Streptantibioticus cattleyicolor NRRL 8057 = DSM 46488]|nr:protein of unknown function [Streptantibioticus cattleyicolor NRRL 8057 = DSM 46488]
MTPAASRRTEARSSHTSGQPLHPAWPVLRNESPRKNAISQPQRAHRAITRLYPPPRPQPPEPSELSYPPPLTALVGQATSGATSAANLFPGYL